MVSTSASHAARCSGVLSAMVQNIRRTTVSTPQNWNTQFRHKSSSGSPKTACSLSGGVFEVFRITAALGLEQANRDTGFAAAGGEIVSDAATQHAVDPALEDGGRLAPPVRVDDDKAIGGLNLREMGGKLRAGRRVHQLLRRHYGIEALNIQIAERDAVPQRMKRFPRSCGDGVIEATVPRVRQNEQDVHIQSLLSIFCGFPEMLLREAGEWLPGGRYDWSI